MAKDFNADFYITCATVIPVLFLAVAVQGQAYEAVLISARHQARTGRHDRRISKLSSGFWSWLLRLVAYAILLAGVVGELGALLTLYDGREGGAKLFVLLSTLALVIAVAAGPLARFATVGFDIQMKATPGVWGDRRNDGDGDPKAASVSPPGYPG